MMPLIALLVRLGIAPRFAKPVLVIVGLIALLGAVWGAKALYDRSVIREHDAARQVKIAKADRKADEVAAVQRRVDDTRISTETAEIKEAINEAGPDPEARRRAYYACVARLQQARASGVVTARC